MGEAFRRRGFAVLESGGAGPDGGVDLLLTKEGKQYLVQCKHWRVQNVGVSVVRELNGVVASRGVAGGYVVASGVFTREAWSFAQTRSIELIDGEKLESMIREVEEGGRVGGAAASTSRSVLECPKCGSPMVRRVAKQGVHAGHAFWGCRGYPACRGTRSAT